MMDTGFRIRPMTYADISGVLEVERASFLTPWSKDAFESELSHAGFSQYFVAEDHNRIIGYGGMWVILDEAHITNIAVHPDERGKKVGEQILLTLIRTAEALGCGGMTLEVRVGNQVAQNLYAKHGFYTRGVRRGYYTDTGEDALIMWRGEYPGRI